MQDFPEIIERMYAGYSFIFRWSFLYYLPVGILYLSSDEKEGIILKVLFFLHWFFKMFHDYPATISHIKT